MNNECVSLYPINGISIDFIYGIIIIILNNLIKYLSKNNSQHKITINRLKHILAFVIIFNIYTNFILYLQGHTKICSSRITNIFRLIFYLIILNDSMIFNIIKKD